MSKTGLYLGKFAPLHKGHEYMINTALSEVDDLYVLIYDCPDVIDVPLSTRAGWIREKFPTVNVLEGWVGPTQTGYSPEIKRKHEEYVNEKIPEDVSITHFYSSEPYGEHMSESLGAVNRCVDIERTEVPISGTKIRNETYKNRKYISDHVYRDLIRNVVFVGGPSTGKTTLAKKLAEKFGTEWMPEYGREYWNKNNIQGRLSKEQLVELAHEHIEKENEKLLESDEILFTDTNAITTYAWCKYYHSEGPEELYELAKSNRTRYDLFVLCGLDIPYEDENGRSGPKNRERLQKITRSFLEHHNIPYFQVNGSIDERINMVEEILDKTNAYGWEWGKWI